MSDDLGNVEFLDPRTVWAHEAREFTPWLLEHADHLSEALGIELDVEQAEGGVGSFAVDLVGRDLTHDAVLIVENQLERTDHSHLGQLLTYAAGTGAATIVWIATEFREEHRQALEWLNESTGQDVRFFGVQLQVVRIGASARAPLLDVSVKPNDWQKQVRAATRAQRASGRGQYYQSFWRLYLETVHSRHPEWTKARTPGIDNWMFQPCSIRGANYSVTFGAQGRLRHEIYIDSGDGERNDELFEVLSAQRESMEQAADRPLAFEELTQRRASRIALYGEGSVTETDRHAEYVDWFIDSGERMRKAVAALELPAEFVQ